MRNFQGIIFVRTRTYREILKSASASAICTFNKGTSYGFAKGTQLLKTQNMIQLVSATWLSSGE